VNIKSWSGKKGNESEGSSGALFEPAHLKGGKGLSSGLVTNRVVGNLMERRVGFDHGRGYLWRTGGKFRGTWRVMEPAREQGRGLSKILGRN